MRQEFAKAIYKLMQENPDIYVVTGDLGWGVLDKIQNMFPERFINTGASEQAMVGIAVGMALKGKKVFVYTISSFFMRAMETINIYLSHDYVPVFLVGSGRDDDYKHDGYSHDATKLQEMMNLLNLDTYYPNDEKGAEAMASMIVENNRPCFISLKR